MVLLVFAAVAVAQSTSDQGGSDQSGSDQTQSSDSSTPVYIHISNQAFDPAQLDVAPGTEVVWVNDAIGAHSVTSDDGELFDSEPIEPGKTYGVWLDGSGTVTYHGGSPDMTGSIVVGGASSGGETTSDEAASDTTQSTEGTQTTEDTQTTEEAQTQTSP
jgi:plastocyanin